MKKLAVILVSLMVATSFAQEKDSTQVENPNAPIENWSLKTVPKVYKFSPLEIFSIIPTFGMDVEARMPNGKNSLQAGVGFIPNSFQILSGENFSDYDWMRGYKLRAEGRAYMPNKTSRYISVGISMRHLIIRDVVAVGMEGFEGEWGQTNYAYFVNTPMTFHRFTTDFSFKYGTQIITTSNFVFDTYIGLNIRSLNVFSSSEIPVGGEVPEQRGAWQLSNGIHRSYPMPVFGFKVGFKR